jgi:hypothetical protein
MDPGRPEYWPHYYPKLNFLAPADTHKVCSDWNWVSLFGLDASSVHEAKGFAPLISIPIRKNSIKESAHK